MSNASELVDVLSRVANIFLQAVDALETRMMQIEQRIEELERGSLGSGAYGAPSPSRAAPMTQDTRRAPMPTPAPPAPPQTQWGSQRQDSYSQPAAPSYQSRPPAYPPQGQSPQPQQSQGYAPQGYSPQGQPPQQGAPPQQGPPGPRPPSNPLNIRQAVTGELKDVFARMRARAEGR